MEPLIDWIPKHSIRPTGIIHVGASLGEEREIYRSLTDRVIWFEANPDLITMLRLNVTPLGHDVIHSAVGNRSGTVTFNVASFYQSSSILPLGAHFTYYPGITYIKQVEVPINRLDYFMADRPVHDMLYMDVQGYEGQVLEGSLQTLRNVKWIYTEYNQEEMYLGCWTLPKLMTWLYTWGFRLIDIAFLHPGWGDALFLRVEP